MKKLKETLRANYIDPSIKNGLTKMALPDKKIKCIIKYKLAL